MRLTIEGTSTRVTDASDDEHRWLSSYMTVKDPKQWLKKWDATLQLFSSIQGTFPSGLVDRVVKAAREEGFVVLVHDARVKPCEPDTMPDTAWLRDYQSEALTSCLVRSRGIVQSPTGSGKTEIIVALSRALPCRWLVISPGADLMEQAAQRYNKRAREHNIFNDRGDYDTAGIVGDGEFSLGERFTSATFATLASAMSKQKKDTRWSQIVKYTQGVICDESHCFVGGTMVGDYPIETIRSGDFVPSWDPIEGKCCLRRVLRTFERFSTEIVRVRLEDGRVITCTGSHPFFTDRGWTAAQSLGGCSVLDCSNATENRGAQCVRVASVEILEPRCDAKPTGVPVFNLEVDGTNTYIVAGIVVHNCAPARSHFNVLQSLSAFYRFGFSGTPLPIIEKDENRQRNMLAIATLGDVIYKVDPERLYDAGTIIRPTVRMVPCYQKGIAPPGATWAEVYKRGVTDSVARNTVLVQATQRIEKPALFFVKNIAHGKEIAAMLGRYGVRAEFAFGAHSVEYRASMLKRLAQGHFDVIVCSVIFQQGIDLPVLRGIVIGSGGKSEIAALQRIGRGMRPDKDKTTFEVVDVRDTGSVWLEKHARQRVAAYRGAGFDVRLV